MSDCNVFKILVRITMFIRIIGKIMNFLISDNFINNLENYLRLIYIFWIYLKVSYFSVSRRFSTLHSLQRRAILPITPRICSWTMAERWRHGVHKALRKYQPVSHKSFSAGKARFECVRSRPSTERLVQAEGSGDTPFCFSTVWFWSADVYRKKICWSRITVVISEGKQSSN